MSSVGELNLVWRWDTILCALLLLGISFKDLDGLNGNNSGFGNRRKYL